MQWFQRWVHSREDTLPVTIIKAEETTCASPEYQSLPIMKLPHRPECPTISPILDEPEMTTQSDVSNEDHSGKGLAGESADEAHGGEQEPVNNLSTDVILDHRQTTLAPSTAEVVTRATKRPRGNKRKRTRRPKKIRGNKRQGKNRNRKQRKRKRKPADDETQPNSSFK